MMVPRQGKWGRGVAHKLQQGEWGMCTRQTVGAMGEVGVVQLVQYGKVSSLSLFNFLAYVIFLSIIILTHAPPLLSSAAPPTTTLLSVLRHEIVWLVLKRCSAGGSSQSEVLGSRTTVRAFWLGEA